MGKIYLCSIGLRLKDITIGTIDILRDCENIFLEVSDDGIEKFFKVNDIKGKITRVTCPQNGDFSKVAAEIIEVSRKNKTAIISYGFPTFLNGLYEALKSKCDAETVLETVPSVGSINVIMDMANISDIAKEGLHFFNGINPGCLETIDAKKHLPCFIFNAHAFLRPNLRKKFISFFKKMSEKGCIFFAIEAPSTFGRKAVNVEINLKIVHNLKFLNRRTTLFIKKGK